MAPTLPGTATLLPRQGDSAGRVLIAEDYPDCADTLAVLLGLCGFETATVVNGPDVLAAADRFAPDVVVLDLGLPGCDGEEVARGLLSRPQCHRPRVIVASGFGDEPRRARLARLGVDAYFVKPFNPEELLSTVRRVCQGREPL